MALPRRRGRRGGLPPGERGASPAQVLLVLVILAVIAVVVVVSLRRVAG